MNDLPGSPAPRAWRVHRGADGTVTAGVACLGWDPGAEPAAGTAVVAIEAAGFNYKDALACTGHAGVMRVTPLVPGIDAAGRLVHAAGTLPAGAAVVVTANSMGEARDGGFATQVRMPVEAVLPRPAGLSAVEAMALGTAGLTTLVACERLATLVAHPHGDWLVTGASGGVGMMAVARLAAAGHRVVACSRKPAARETLLALGAAEVAGPAEIVAPPGKSLAKGRWAGVVDTVGGPLLADVLRSVHGGGAVAAIGMAGGADLVTTVHPFILRGITLVGIDTATQCTQADRRRLWDDLAAFWPPLRDRFPVTRLGLDEVGIWAERMLRGETVGRAVVVP
jgi:acrylyl-CoA reductase (NADPH)